MSTAENEIKRSALQYLELLNIPATKHQSGKIRIGNRIIDMGDEGWPDIIAVFCGRFLGIEVKTDEGKLSKSQMHRKREIERCGGIYLVVHSVNDMIDKINEIEKLAT